MTFTEFYKYNETKSMPYEWIGQGYGYKYEEKKWEDIDNDEIIYIPEYGYNQNNDFGYEQSEKESTVNRSNAYSKRDLKEVVKEKYPKVKGELLDRLACILFEAIDWQFPTTAVDEEWLLSDEDKERLGLED